MKTAQYDLLDFLADIRKVNKIISSSLSYGDMISLKDLRYSLSAIDPSELDILLMRIKNMRERKSVLFQIREEVFLFLAKYSENEDTLIPQFHNAKIIYDEIELKLGCRCDDIFQDDRDCDQAFIDFNHLLVYHNSSSKNDKEKYERCLKELSAFWGYEVTYEPSCLREIEKKINNKKEKTLRDINRVEGLYYELKDAIETDVLPQINELLYKVGEVIKKVDSNEEYQKRETAKKRSGYSGYPKYQSLSECLGKERFEVFKEVANQYIANFDSLDPRFCSYAIQYYGGAKSLKCSVIHFVELIKGQFNKQCPFEAKSVYAHRSNDEVRDKWLYDTFKKEAKRQQSK